MAFDHSYAPQIEKFSGWDVAIIVIASIVYAADIAALTFMYRKQRCYLPFRSKNMLVFVLAQCCGALYWVFQYGYLVSSHRDMPRSYCVIVLPWIAFGLGIYSYLILLNYRIYLFVWLMVIKRSARSIWFHVCFIPVYLPTIVFVVTASASHEFVSTYSSPNPGLCKYGIGYYIFTYVNTSFLILVSIVLGILSRKVRKAFVAYWETLISAIACIILIVLSEIGNSHYLNRKGWGRFVLMLISLLIVNIYFWLTVAYPLYGYFFRRQEYLEEFNARLSQDRLDELGQSDDTPLSAQLSSSTAVHSNRETKPKNIDHDFFSDRASIERVFRPEYCPNHRAALYQDTPYLI
ncbi:hypothetical protein IWQ62_000171 [Dispira parvispora]|uniref:Uncharacterized protein n=1 Tax=Dispira parvispora TaxID=1520584 RepID=A0A9W8E6C9_9FUNG|nr:hypothetical protein IWQ62_000171 [Dispira parvispora]